MEDYIHHGYCDDTFANFTNNEKRILRAKAIKAVKNMGYDASNDTSQDELCSRLKQTCTVSKGGDCKEVPEANRITLRCGGKTKCYDVFQLQEMMGLDANFAAKFSDYQKKRIARFAKALKSETVPCFLRNDSVCQSDQCNLSGGWLSKTKCQLNTDYVKNIGVDWADYPLTDLRAAAQDIWHQNLQIQMMRESDDKRSLLHIYNLNADYAVLMDTYMENVNNMSKEEVRDFLEEFVELNKDDLKRSFDLYSYAAGMQDRYITPKFVEAIQDLFGLKLSEKWLRWISILINIMLFVYESLLVPWGVWLLAFPGGREMLNKLLHDPKLLLVFLFSFTFSGLQGDVLLPNIGKLKLVIPEPVLKQMASLAGVDVKPILESAGANVTRALPDIIRAIGKKLRKSRRNVKNNQLDVLAATALG